MNEPVKLRDSKAFLIIDIFGIIFFALCLILSTISGLRKQDIETLLICIPVFGGFTLLCALMLPAHVCRFDGDFASSLSSHALAAQNKGTSP